LLDDICAEIDKLVKAAADLEGMEAQIGWFEEAAYNDGTPVAAIANIHEHGAPAAGIPPRRPIALSHEEHGEEWEKSLTRGVKAVTDGRITAKSMFTQLAQKVAGDQRETLSRITDPPLKDSTIKARMRRRGISGVSGDIAQPLNDTGHMIATLTGVAVPRSEE
jgi:hypothetical protein